RHVRVLPGDRRRVTRNLEVPDVRVSGSRLVRVEEHRGLVVADVVALVVLVDPRVEAEAGTRLAGRLGGGFRGADAHADEGHGESADQQRGPDESGHAHAPLVRRKDALATFPADAASVRANLRLGEPDVQVT